MIKKRIYILAALVLILILSAIYLVHHTHHTGLEKDAALRQDSIQLYQDSILQTHIQDSIKRENLQKQYKAEARTNFIKDSL